jgi:hypothetical protein
LRFDYPCLRRCRHFENLPRGRIVQIGFGSFNSTHKPPQPEYWRDVAHNNKSPTAIGEKDGALDDFVLVNLGATCEPNAMLSIKSLEELRVRPRDAIDLFSQLLHLPTLIGGKMDDAHRISSRPQRPASVAMTSANSEQTR